ncbi:MAG: saccharopine dehydrogenase C-terminal domain-containing protein [Caldilineaceae bacterium]
MKIIVLGAGLIGAPLAADLAGDGRYEVTVADYSEIALLRAKNRCEELQPVRADFSDLEALRSLVEDCDFVVNAVPGFMGFETAKAILQAGKDSVCISFYEEDPFELDSLAREQNVTMIVDCGVSPGLVNALVMETTRKLDSTETVRIYIGGLPEVRRWPSDYKAVFSPIDVIEEYTRPARCIENGHEVIRPALSDREYIFFPEVGTLEAFATDGLRTMVKTIAAPNMKEKTLRYPGHAEQMAMLRELGFFSKKESILVGETMTSPLAMTAQILFPNWQLHPGERDLTVMKLIIEGTKDGVPTRHTIDMLDRYDPDTEVISMARTTGYTAALAARMVAEGLYTEKGISPPEYLGKHPACMSYLGRGLAERGIEIVEIVTEIVP